MSLTEQHYSIEPRERKYVKGCGFLSFAVNLSSKYRKQLMNTGLYSLKTASKKVVHKATEATDKFIGNKIVDKGVKTKPVMDENSRNVEETIIRSK